MKKIYKYLLLTITMVGLVSLNSCETVELELLEDPNELTQGEPEFLFNSIQNAYRATQVTFNDRSSELTRIDNLGGTGEYFSTYNAGTLNGPWSNLYSTINPDLEAIIALETPDNDLSFAIGAAKVMQAHILMQLVDYLGDIPWSEAGQPDVFPTPALDDDSAVYDTAIAILDEAIAELNSVSGSVAGIQDLYYDKNPSSWIKLANTLKMRAALTTSDFTTFNTLVSQPHIEDSSDDMQFNFGNQLAPVNTQHQDYQNDYRTDGANTYQSNWLMYTMSNLDDPRIRYYFYRQTGCTPGASCQPDGQTDVLQCSTDGIPPHISGTDTEPYWCYLENGYWGRLHMNSRGIPPDNSTRTAVGVYPAGGRIDGDSFRTGNVVENPDFDPDSEVSTDNPRFIFDYTNPAITLGQGNEGAGIEPIILASYVDFWKAEAALSPGGAGVGMAAMHLRSGLEKSILKVQTAIPDPTFGAGILDDSVFDINTGEVTTSVLPSSLLPNSTDVAAYIDEVVDSFEMASGDDQWNILAEQYFITMYGGGADAYNFYRRTGYPTTVGLSFEPAPGNFPRTFLYPQDEVIANPNINQRNNNDDAVFWNTQPLPEAN